MFFFLVAAALQSVFPQSELATFMSLTKADKEQQLSELTMIVTGIRLFNKDCRKGGEGIEDRKDTISHKIDHKTVLDNACFLTHLWSHRHCNFRNLSSFVYTTIVK